MNIVLDQLLQAQVMEHGSKIALKCGDESVTYAQLQERAARVAGGLLAAGVLPGDRVGYLGKNSLAYFEFFLGAQTGRAVTVPINWRLAGPEVEYVVSDARLKYLLVEPQFEALAAAVAPGIPRRVINDSREGFAAWRDRQSSLAHRDGEVDWEEPLLQLYTSGTTGKPKGAVLTHRSLLGLRAMAESIPPWFQWSAQDVSLIAMPVAHVSGTGWAIWTLQHGATGVIIREFDPHAVFEQIVANRISKLMMVPTAMQIAVRHPRARETDFGFLRYMYYGGAPLPPELLAECVRVFGCGFVQMYGMTETSGTIVALAPEDHDPARGRLRSVGRPLAGVELKIVDEAGRELPTGATGEIVTRSAANMTAYFQNPAATAQTLDAQGWLRTGDAGYLDAAGYLYLQDRIKDMIISGGENIYPTEVENAIYGHPDVAEVAVIGVPDEKWGEAVKAVVVPRPGAAPSAADLIAWAAGRIARYKLPKSVDFVAALPRNHTGKILRRQLRDAYRDRIGDQEKS